MATGVEYGKRLKKLCAAFRGAEDELTERTIRNQAGWLRTIKQLKFMQWVEGLMDTYHWAINDKTIEILQSKLKVVTLKVETVMKIPDTDSDTSSTNESNVAVTPRRWKYTLLKESIDETI
ncbi:hypothetical protein HD806DRAFT_530979 [Xylariaceae sp. AK1471]|nr:hypothetical protein HD806DRAFT_530979 [Xylariaceae sp. AK1471]